MKNRHGYGQDELGEQITSVRPKNGRDREGERVTEDLTGEDSKPSKTREHLKNESIRMNSNPRNLLMLGYASGDPNAC